MSFAEFSSKWITGAKKKDKVIIKGMQKQLQDLEESDDDKFANNLSAAKENAKIFNQIKQEKIKTIKRSWEDLNDSKTYLVESKHEQHSKKSSLLLDIEAIKEDRDKLQGKMKEGENQTPLYSLAGELKQTSFDIGMVSMIEVTRKDNLDELSKKLSKSIAKKAHAYLYDVSGVENLFVKNLISMDTYMRIYRNNSEPRTVSEKVMRINGKKYLVVHSQFLSKPFLKTTEKIEAVSNRDLFGRHFVMTSPDFKMVLNYADENSRVRFEKTQQRLQSENKKIINDVIANIEGKVAGHLEVKENERISFKELQTLNLNLKVKENDFDIVDKKIGTLILLEEKTNREITKISKEFDKLSKKNFVLRVVETKKMAKKSLSATEVYEEMLEESINSSKKLVNKGSSINAVKIVGFSSQLKDGELEYSLAITYKYNQEDPELTQIASLD